MNPIKITKDTKLSNIYRLEWEDGVLSEDFYNKTRAYDILRNYDLYQLKMKKRGNNPFLKAICSS